MTDAPSPLKTYRARWVWSAERWWEDARVTVAGRQIVSVGTERLAGEIDLGDCVILPGLVNAHTHLEFSGLTAPLPYDKTFASWIRNVVVWRRGEMAASARQAIERGLAESAQAGVTLLGEIATRGIGFQPVLPDEEMTGWKPIPRSDSSDGSPWDTPAALDMSDCHLTSPPSRSPQLVVFREVLGLKPDAIQPQMADACRHLTVGAACRREGEAPAQPREGEIAASQPRLGGSLALPSLALPTNDWSPNWTAGLSPHAPYSLSRELFSKVLDLAKQSRCPVAMHLAETREELELLATGTGPLAELFTEWGLWSTGQRAAFRSPWEVLQQLSSLPRVLVIHGNYLTPEELDFLTGKDQFSVVYCPRTHSYFQHDRYPLAELLKRGIRVALGTDSRASNPDLNLLSEVRHVAQQHPEIAPTMLLEMATSHGAEALGLGHSVGCIAPGMRADLCVLPIPPGIRDPFEAVLAPN